MTFAIAAMWNAAVIGAESLRQAPTLTSAAVASGIDVARQVLRRATVKAGNDDLKGADRELQALIAHSAFNELGSSEQHKALFLAADVALDLGHNVRAHSLFLRSTAMSEADSDDWHGRLDAAYRLKNYLDAVSSLNLIAQRWPETLDTIKDAAIFQVAREAKKLPGKPEAWFELVHALYDGNWQTEYEQQPNSLWRDLTLSLLERNQADKAIDAARRITDPYVLLGMRVDKRYQRAVAASPAHFDIQRAANATVEEWRRLATTRPRALKMVVQTTYALLDANRAVEALDLADQTLARVSAAAGDAPPYDDIEDELVWIMDNRARALMKLDRWAEATDQLESAQRANRGDANQAINLGYLYMNLDRPKQALESIAKVSDLSDYGRTQVEAVRAGAAVEMNDAAAAERALAYLREHQDDSVSTLQDSLVRADRIEEAAKLLVSRLADPERRHAALLAVQQYPESPSTPRLAEWRGRWVGVVARPEVQAAITKVGRVERIAIAEP